MPIVAVARRPHGRKPHPGAPSGAGISHVLGVAATSAGGTYRARATEAATIQLEYSTNSDLSGSTITTGVAVDDTTDYTGGEAISGLSADTVYYYEVRVDGARSGKGGRFKTFPTTGAVKIVTVSCNLDANDPGWAVIRAENPDLVVHLGDRGYPDTTDLAALRASYRDIYDPNGDFAQEIVTQVPLFCIWSDHDFGGNNEDGDLANKANAKQAFIEYTATTGYVASTHGIHQTATCGPVDLVLLDGRYQREGSKPRYPDAAPGTWATAQAGTGGATVVVPSNAPSALGSDGRWYCDINGIGVYLVWGYVHATKTVTLTESVPGLDAGAEVAFKRASMLDMNGASGQVEWLIDTVNESENTWKLVCSGEMWNRTFTGSGSNDSWGGWDTEQFERRYIRQRWTADNRAVASGDRHYLAIDDGTNSDEPELMSSPIDNTNIALGGGATWSHGSYHAGKGYGVIEADESELTLTAKDASGGTASGITPLTVMAA